MRKNKYIIISLIAGLLYIVWAVRITPELLSLPEDFSYHVNLFSHDNFFSEELNSFTGEQRTVAVFDYTTRGSNKDVLDIEASLDVRTTRGEPIISINRSYAINAKTKRHVSEFGDRQRIGYLFGPANHNKSDFYYWHINYNEPALMHFQNEEMIQGLPVYRFATEYHADQTQDLTHLPGVPEERGVELDISLQLWIEPETGYLIKYQDDTTAYYYDINTKERLHPWNRFGNAYSQRSVTEHVAQARQLITQKRIDETIVPAMFAIVILTSLMYGWVGSYSIIFAILGIISAGILGYLSFPQSTTIYPKKIGIIRWVESAEYDTNVSGFKRALQELGYVDGKNVYYFDQTSYADLERHAEILNSYKELGVDLIYSLSTSGTLAAKDLVLDIPIVFSVVSYPVEAGIINSMHASGNNLVGTRNYVSMNRQWSAFRQIAPHAERIAFVRRTGEANSQIQLDEFRSLFGDRINIIELDGNDITELVSELESFNEDIDGAFASCDTLVQSDEGRGVYLEFIRRLNIPDFNCTKTGVATGSLIGTVADFEQLGKTSGHLAATIFDGASPNSLISLGVLYPLLVINEHRADELGIDIPQSIQLKAEEVIR